MIIREVTEEDMPQVLEIEREAISPPWTHGALLRDIYNNDSFFIGCFADNVLLGFAIFRRAADEGELLQIAVDKAARRRGAADMLMSETLDRARGAGVDRAYLEVRKSNDAAIGLYIKHGFTFSGVRRNYYADPVEDAAVMKLGTLSRTP